MSLEHPDIKPDQLDPSRLDDENLVAPAPKQWDDFHERFDDITEGLGSDSIIATPPPETPSHDTIGTGEEEPSNKPRLLRRVGASFLATAVLAGAGYLGSKALGGDKDPNEGTIPQATEAPLTPGGQEEVPAPAEVLTPVSDITDSEVRELNGICSAYPMSGFGNGADEKWISRFYKLPQQDVDNLRIAIGYLDQVSDETDRDRRCKEISLAVKNSLGL